MTISSTLKKHGLPTWTGARSAGRITAEPQPMPTPVRPKQKSPLTKARAAGRLLDRTPQLPARGRAGRWLRGIAIALASLLCLIILTLAGFRGWAALREQDTAEARAPIRGQLVATSKGRLFLQDLGPKTAPAIVLIHGTAAWSEFWNGTTDFLVRRGFRVIAIDLPPFGYSDRSPDAAYTRNDQALRINEALDALKIKQATFIGHSFGAGATVETVLRHSDKVQSLILVAGALGLPQTGQPLTEPPALLMKLLDRPFIAEPLIAATVTNPLLTQQLMRMMLHRKEVVTPELAAILQRPMTLKGSTAEMTRWIKSFITPDRHALSMTPDNYSRIAVPTRLIWGNRDTLTPLAQGERLASLIPGSKLSVLEGLGHIPQIEDPIAFQRLLAALLDDLKPQAPEPTPIRPPPQ